MLTSSQTVYDKLEGQKLKQGTFQITSKKQEFTNLVMQIMAQEGQMKDAHIIVLTLLYE